jgi:hypothetical protein
MKPMSDGKTQKDFHQTGDKGGFVDDKIHTAILADGDHEAAKKVSDEVARDVGLTEAEIEALSAPPPTRGKKK